jgi:serine/threonine protein phosphatase PrpC
MKEAIVQMLCRELLAGHDEHASVEELHRFIEEADITTQICLLAENIVKKWSSWKEKNRSSTEPVLLLEEENIMEEEKKLPVQEFDKPENSSMSEIILPQSEARSTFLRIPNAMVNTPYSQKITVEGSLFSKIIKIEGLEAAGLTYDGTNQSLSGTPKQPGEFKFNVTYLSTSGGSASALLPFVVNYDPKSLWKDIPSDHTVKFWKEDEAVQGLTGDKAWNLVGASKRGRSHAHEGKCRDDDFALMGTHPQQWHILAVSDGAGSSQYSREGARLAVQIASQVLAEKLTEHNATLLEAIAAWDQAGQSSEAATSLRQTLYTVLSQAIYAAINTIHQTSKKEQSKFRDFYATLLLAAHREIEGKHFVVGYWIGDGGMAVYEAGQSVHLLGQADSGEYAGQTRFLDPEANDGADINKRISFTLCKEMTALFLLTDGITDPIFETDYNLGQVEQWHRFWQEIIQEKLADEPEKTAENLLDWLSFWSPGNHDDRTLALLYRGK